ncbi:hypothetical protein [Nodosilinea sp. E11]|uniref:hypothetical protein n=1 Tax=Nodosilinea sp. E11 TaxID=3037479 RepID=UPI0029341C1A|nr:hypothetical protein [Nodosilinea sp. E11]WOD37362.1 hypothetical protein RRF56_02490 [Nodosilinea sp. E11]
MKLSQTLFAIAAFAGLFSAIQTPAQAGSELTTSYSNQLQLVVNPAVASVEARGANISMSGSGLTAVVLPIITVAGATTPGTAAVAIDTGVIGGLTAQSFTYSQSAYSADIKATGTTLSSTITTPAFGIQSLTNGGIAGTLAGTIDNQSNGTVTAGGAGTVGVLTQTGSMSVFR